MGTTQAKVRHHSYVYGDHLTARWHLMGIPPHADSSPYVVSRDISADVPSGKDCEGAPQR